jgi:hypothetical protein
MLDIDALAEDILDIDIPAEIKEDDENILEEKEDILDINTPAEIEEDNEEEDVEI